MVTGEKQIETRSWAPPSTLRPGDWVAIHHSARWDRDIVEVLYEEITSEPEDRSDYWAAYLAALVKHGCTRLADVPIGAILGACRYTGAERTTKIDRDFGRHFADYSPSPNERYFGDYSPNRWGWLFDAFYRLPEPIPAKGKQGIWFIDTAAESAISDGLREAGHSGLARPDRLILAQEILAL